MAQNIWLGLSKFNETPFLADTEKLKTKTCVRIEQSVYNYVN